MALWDIGLSFPNYFFFKKLRWHPWEWEECPNPVSGYVHKAIHRSLSIHDLIFRFCSIKFPNLAAIAPPIRRHREGGDKWSSSCPQPTRVSSMSKHGESRSILRVETALCVFKMECAKNRPLPLYVLNCCALSVNWDGETAAECIVRVNYNQFISKSLNLGQEKKWPTLSSAHDAGSEIFTPWVILYFMNN